MLNTASRKSAASLSEVMLAAFGVMLLGSFLLYGVGFAQPQALHDAAHDTRHSFAFPCH